jgi:PAS domain S-box-containing protein
MSASEAAGQPAKEPDSFGPFRYPLAGLLVLATVGVQLALNPIPTPVIPLLVSLLAVFVTAYFCGRAPALCVTAANLLANWYFFTQPRFSFAVADPAEVWRLTIFAAAGTIVSLLSHRLSDRRHLPAVALMLASSVLLVIAAVLVWLDFEHSRDAEGWVEHTYQVLNASEELLTTFQDAEGGQRNYLLTGDERYMASYRAAVASELAATQRLGELTVDNAAQKARLAELDRLTRTRLALLGRAIAVRRQQSDQAATDMVRAGEGALVMGQIRTILGAVKSEEHRLLNQRTKLASDQAARIRWALAMGPALLVAVLILAGMIIESYLSKLQASERMLRRQADLLDKVPGPIIVWQLGGAIEYWNHGAEELYGFSRQQAVGRSHNDLLHPIHPLGMPAIQELLARDGEWSGELMHVIDGREIVVESRMTLVTEPDGRKTVLKANRDITQEKRAHEEIRQLNRELEQRVTDRTAQIEASNKESEAFAYSVSHDLRAPLRGIDGWSQALIEDYGPQLDQKAHQYLVRVREETQRMGHLIDDLLKLSRLTRVELHYESVDLTALARTIACRLRESEPTRNVDFVIQEGLATRGDGRLLEIVLSNLLNNAVKFTGPRAVARIEFGQTRCQEELAFYVRDNGVGFDMAYSKMLYGAFQRLHKHTEFPGTGIGLATVQRVLRRHGGRIWADAKPDEGATFYFTIGTDSSH